MLSKKYYESIAEIISKQDCSYEHTEMMFVIHIDKIELVYALATYFRLNNPRFDGKKFILACKQDKQEVL